MSAAKWTIAEWRGPTIDSKRGPTIDGIQTRICDYGPSVGIGYQWYIHDHRPDAKGTILDAGRADTLEEAQAQCEAALARFDGACPPSSLTGAACLLPPGHDADSPTRFHRYAAPECLQ